MLERDLDTPGALTLIDTVFDRWSSEPLVAIDRDNLISFIESIDQLLGLQIIDGTPDISDETKQLILERQRARDQKDWAASDDLRREIEKSGVTIRDTASGPVWEYLA